MPSNRPCAAFEPISPDLDLAGLVKSTPNFEYVDRIHCDMIDHHGLVAFERLILTHVIMGGKPIVIEGYGPRLDRSIFSMQWLKDNCGKTIIDARDLTKQANIPMTIGHYLSNMNLLASQCTSRNYKDLDRQRLYLKDIDCPKVWHDEIARHIPPLLFYLNESTGIKSDQGIARSGDLMSSLPEEMRAENLMCYIGHEGTYTPAHREMCASLGHNIMVEASTGETEDGNVTKPGSSIWFMTESKEREVVSEYWLSRLGHDIEVEKHFAQINAWKSAPFTTYVVEQKPGDFILIPPLAPHQVWNRGTRTMKIAWNRTTVETLDIAMDEALFKARMVCRDEQYKNKAIVYFSLQKYARCLQEINKHTQSRPGSKILHASKVQTAQLQKDFKRLHRLYTKMLIEESFSEDCIEKNLEMIPFDSNISCSYCRCNIFNRFLTCPSCVEDLPDGSQDTYDICLDCYAMGRSCACISNLRWVEQWDWSKLLSTHETWRQILIQHEGQSRKISAQSLKNEIVRCGNRRSMAQICQAELSKRPWQNIKLSVPKPSLAQNEEEVSVDDRGHIKKKRVKKSEKFKRDHARCHVDYSWEPRWKQAQCTKCEKNFCYGVLNRAYDMMPQEILANPEWECPACLKICGCRRCRKQEGWKQYTPKGTLLGHNTKAVADPRSVESLVDFSFSNIQWIKKADDDYEAGDTRRLQKRRWEADAAIRKDVELGDNYVNGMELDRLNVEDSLLKLTGQQDTPIDPTLDSSLDWSPDQHDSNSSSTFDTMINEYPEEAIRHDLEVVHTGPRFVLPNGGIIQDPRQAYELTDAVTYTYPEPVSDTNPPPLIRNYLDQITEAQYVEVDPQSPTKIEMVQRKRKRKTDGDEKVPQRTSLTGKPASQKR